MKNFTIGLLTGLISIASSAQAGGLNQSRADFATIHFKTDFGSIDQAVNGYLIPTLTKNENGEGDTLLKKAEIVDQLLITRNGKNLSNYSSFVVNPYHCEHIKTEGSLHEFKCDVTLIKGFFD